jgi:hypothetical protein
MSMGGCLPVLMLHFDIEEIEMIEMMQERASGLELDSQPRGEHSSIRYSKAMPDEL